MRVETGGLIYDDSDKRCTIYVQNTVMGGQIAYIVLLSCLMSQRVAQTGITVSQSNISMTWRNTPSEPSCLISCKTVVSAGTYLIA